MLKRIEYYFGEIIYFKFQYLQDLNKLFLQNNIRFVLII